MSLPPLVVPPRLRSTWRFGRVPMIEPLLGARIVPRELPWRAVDGVIGWGRKLTGQRALALARRTGLPWLLAEDGFLRSVGLGDVEPALSIVLDDRGIYYDAREPSRLEALVAGGHGPAERARARALAAAWRAARVSKYNHARERHGLLAPGEVLVVDQTAGDSSIACGLADAGSFRRMLEAALDEHPQAGIVLKVHPDVVAGRKRGHFDRLSPGEAARVRVLADDAHPPALLEAAAAVYCVTSQMGFEALLWGRPVRCFGMPFYAGWGLTGDELAPPARRGAATLDGLVHAALVDYPRYLHPETRQRCEPEALLAWMALQRRMRGRFPPAVRARPWGRWRPARLRAFFDGSRVQVGDGPGPLVHCRPGLLAPPDGPADALHDRHWLMDAGGDPFDPAKRSALEQRLATLPLEPASLARAAALRERLAGPARPAGPGVLLIADGAAEEVALRATAAAEHPGAPLRVWRGDGPWRAALGDEAVVHVGASPLGFLALLGGRRVVCHGQPFYAGWGLTEDRAGAPAVRGRALPLDALVQVVLIEAAAGIDRVSGRFATPERLLDDAASPGAPLPSGGMLLAHDLGQGLLAALRGRR